MLTRNGRIVLGVVGSLLILGIVASAALSAPAPNPPAPQASAPQAPAPQASAPQHPPGAVHYHFHNHYHHAPLPSLLQQPLYPQTTARDAATNLVAPSFMGWPYAPLPTPTGRGVSYGTIHVFLPVAEAALYLNGQIRPGTGKDRIIKTPPLPMNKDYQYILTARLIEDGEPTTAYRKVILGAGDYQVADFTKPAMESPARFPSGPVGPASMDPD